MLRGVLLFTYRGARLRGCGKLVVASLAKSGAIVAAFARSAQLLLK